MKKISQKYDDCKTALVKIFNHERADLTTSNEPSLPDYSYSCDNYIGIILSNILVRKAIASLINRYYSDQIKNILSVSQLVSQNKFPRIYALAKECQGALSLAKMPQILITSKLPGINALSVEYDKNVYVLLSHRAALALPQPELRFLLGHEFGHLAQGNLICHTVKGLLDRLNNGSDILGPIVSDLLIVPLSQWHRCSEFTADRAGLICCKDIKAVENLFIRVFGISCLNSLNAISAYNELDESHPLPNTRLKELKKYEPLIS